MFAILVLDTLSSPLHFFPFQVWFQNRRAKFRKTERMSQHSGGSKNSENEGGNRTPGSPGCGGGGEGVGGEKSTETPDITVDNIKEEKVVGSHLVSQHESPLEALSNKARNDNMEGKNMCNYYNYSDGSNYSNVLNY